MSILIGLLVIFGSAAILGCATGIIYHIFETSHWYRTRQFKRLRNELNHYDRYKIYCSEHLFGFYSGDDGYLSTYSPLASSPKQALLRYYNWYRRKYKEEQDGFDREHFETSYKWGFFKIVNTKTGFTTYMK